MFKGLKNIITSVLFLIINCLYFSMSAPCFPSSPEPIKALWMETTSNLYLLKDREAIGKILDKIQDAGFNTIIPEAKNSYGYALYQSKIAPTINSLGVAYNQPLEYPISDINKIGHKLPADYDILKTLIEEAHKRNIKVITAIDVFSEGLNPQKIGPAFDHPEWQSILYINGQFIPSSKSGLLTFVNPLNPDVIEYELSILEELMKNYEIDGIVLDRARYANINADFSLLSRQAFEKVYGQPIRNWPEDIFANNSLYNRWISFRAQNIKNFIILARQKQKEIKPNILFMDYVAGWYGTYYNEGVNWAAEGYDPRYYWTDKYWSKAGIADLLDCLMVGVYYRNTAMIENNIYLAQKITQNRTKIIPAIYLKIHSPADIAKIAKTIRKTAPDRSIMIFDLSHIEKDGAFWKEIKKALNK